MAGHVGDRRKLNHYVADTHALFWYLTASPKLGQKAKEAFFEASRGDALIYIPAIVLAELHFLNEKLERPFNFLTEFQRIQQSSQFILVSLHPEDILDFDMDSRIPEMHDRMIVGVARRLGIPCLSRDRAISTSQLVAIIWD